MHTVTASSERKLTLR